MQLKWTSSPRNRGLENFEVRPSLSTIQIYSSSQNASLCSAPAPDQMGPRQRSWARFASPQHGQSEPQSVGRSGGAGAQGSGCKMPMFMSVLYGRSRIDCGFDATQDSNLEFRIADSRAWIAKSEFSGSIGKSCITAVSGYSYICVHGVLRFYYFYYFKIQKYRYDDDAVWSCTQLYPEH